MLTHHRKVKAPHPFLVKLGLVKLVTLLRLTVRLSLVMCCFLAYSTSYAESKINKPVFTVDNGLFDSSKPPQMKAEQLEQVHTSIAYEGKLKHSQYNHGAVLTAFKDKLYLQWQSSLKDEDAEDTVVRFSHSNDGKTWADASILVPAREGAIVTNGGWWSDGETLVAYINVWPIGQNPRGGYTEYITSSDGVTWSQPKALMLHNDAPMLGIIEQDLKSLPNGTLLTSAHIQPGLKTTPIYTPDPLGIKGWKLGKINNETYSGSMSQYIEPSWLTQANGNIVMVFRDQYSSYRSLASLSSDLGQTWTTPSLTAMPDSRSKQSAGNLSDGTAYIVNNPSGNRNRYPLAVTLSADGYNFTKSVTLRSKRSLPTMRFQGRYKREGFSYPKSIVWRDHLWISYAVNKEDIAVTHVPEKLLSLKGTKLSPHQKAKPNN